MTPREQQTWDAIYAAVFAGLMVMDNGRMFCAHTAETAAEVAREMADEGVARMGLEACPGCHGTGEEPHEPRGRPCFVCSGAGMRNP